MGGVLKSAQLNALAYKLIQTICLLFAIYTVPLYLDNRSQGYYYLYLNLASIQVFVELGLGTFLVNYSSALRERGTKTNSKLGSLLKKVVSYARYNSGLYIFIASMYVYIFGDEYMYKDNIHYTLIYIIIIALDVSKIPLLSIVSGCGDIVEVYRMKTVKALLEAVVLWVALKFGFGLNALIVAASISLVIVILFLNYIKRNFFLSILKSYNPESQVNWMTDIFPMQWKMGLSWISGWLLFSSIVPISFKLIGPVEAGQIGMTLSMVLGLASASSMVVNAVSPKMAKYAALRDRVSVDRLAIRTANFSFSVYIFGALIIAFISYYIETFPGKYSERILPLDTLIFVLIGVGAQQFTMPITAYMFAYIKHPFVFESLLLGVLTISAIYMSGLYFGIYGMTISFMLVQVVVAVPIFVYKIFVFRKVIG